MPALVVDYLLTHQFLLIIKTEFTGFETNQEALLKKCEVYHGYDTKWMTREDSPGRYYTHCLYVKTHEPFFERPPPKIGSLILTVDRAAVILRHPFDSALSEFKR